MVVVEKAVDAFVIAQRIESLVHIRYGVQYNIVLPVQFRIIWAALLSQCQKGKVVHETLEHIAGSPCFSRLSDVGDFLGGDAALEIGVTNLKPTRTVRECDGKVTLAVVGVTGLHYILFLPVPDLFLYLVNRKAGQETIAVLSPAVGSSDRKSPACQKRKIPGVHAVSVPQSAPAGKVHGR